MKNALETYLEGRDDINPATLSSIRYLHMQDVEAARWECPSCGARHGLGEPRPRPEPETACEHDLTAFRDGTCAHFPERPR